MNTLAIIILLFLIAATPAVGSDLAASVRHLAENVLGAGSVTSLTVTDRGATVLLRWESATFRTNQRVDALKNGLVAEAQLATGSILGRLHTVSRIKFSIMRADAMLAAGENNRTRGLTLVFAGVLGGGVYVPIVGTAHSSSSGADAAKD